MFVKLQIKARNYQIMAINDDAYRFHRAKTPRDGIHAKILIRLFIGIQLQ